MKKKHRNLIYALIALVILSLASALFLIISEHCESPTLRAGLYGAVFVVTLVLFIDAPHVFFRSEMRLSKDIASVIESVLNGAPLDSSLSAIEEDELKMINEAAQKRRDASVRIAAAAHEEKASVSSLSSSLDKADTTFNVVDGFVSTMNTDASTLKAQVESVKDSLEKILSGINSLDSKIASQRQSVSSAVSSIEKVIDGMKSILTTAKTDSVNVKELVSSSERGRDIFAETHDEILRIGDAVARIQDIVSVIQDIAEKTTLLSLNASIEAAHAGDVGKGFAVVAEEMADLAEACSENSTAITISISEIIENINAMVSSSGEPETSFSQTTSNVSTANHSTNNLSSNIEKSSNDNEAVLQMMRSLREIADGLSGDSVYVTQGSNKITSSIDDLDALINRVNDNTATLSTMVDGLKDTITGFKAHTEALNRLTSGMDGLVGELVGE